MKRRQSLMPAYWSYFIGWASRTSTTKHLVRYAEDGRSLCGRAIQTVAASATFHADVVDDDSICAICKKHL